MIAPSNITIKVEYMRFATSGEHFTLVTKQYMGRLIAIAKKIASQMHTLEKELSAKPETAEDTVYFSVYYFETETQDNPTLQVDALMKGSNRRELLGATMMLNELVRLLRYGAVIR